MTRVAPILTSVCAGIPIPAKAAKKTGSKTLYPFDTLKAPRPLFEMQVERDAKGAPKIDKTTGQPKFILDEANQPKYVLDEATGIPKPLLDDAGQPQKEYDSFGVKDKKRGNLTSTVSTANKRAKNGENYVVHDVDPTTDPDGAAVRVWRMK